MLRSLSGTWGWHRTAERSYPLSDSLPLHNFVVISNNYLYKLLNRSNMAGFCFEWEEIWTLIQSNTSTHSKLAVNVSFCSCFGSLMVM